MRTIVIVLAAAGLLFVVGFLLFAINVLSDPTEARVKADAIVVLTGGEQRIRAGVELLANGQGQRLLISGVNEKTSARDLVRATGVDGERFACCVDLGYTALNTVGNAKEIRTWAEARQYKSLIVVTSSYHMPRSLIELRRLLPGFRLIPHAVSPRSPSSHPLWWVDWWTWRVMLSEYVKLIPAVARYGVDVGRRSIGLARMACGVDGVRDGAQTV
ncbi:MAG: YdcF family protein [Hyphomicrobium sp.]|nr:YdcF family protein [Hyphomicrobium sp.]